MPRDIFRIAYSAAMPDEGSDTAELMLYGEIIQDGPECFKWSKEDKSAAEFDRAIKALREKGAKKLNVRINSPGGICTEAVAMRSILGSAGFDEINIRIEGMCASAATDIATLPGAHVQITEGSEYMIHNPWSYACGTASEFEHAAQRLRSIEQTSRQFYMKRCGKDEEQVKKWMDAETWFTAEKAVEAGFADEVIYASVGRESPAAACVTSREMAVMRSLYRDVPQQIAVRQETQQNVSNEAPVAGASAEIHQNEEEQTNMDIGSISMEELRAQNPALVDQIRQSAVTAERERMDDIDALTIPGYEQMAAEAKKNGTSALEFQKSLVAAMKQKGANFMQARAQETSAAQAVTGGAPDDIGNEASEIAANAKAIAEYARQYAGANATMY